jgi:hypothetical protein
MVLYRILTDFSGIRTFYIDIYIIYSYKVCIVLVDENYLQNDFDRTNYSLIISVYELGCGILTIMFLWRKIQASSSLRNKDDCNICSKTLKYFINMFLLMLIYTRSCKLHH